MGCTNICDNDAKTSLVMYGKEASWSSKGRNDAALIEYESGTRRSEGVEDASDVWREGEEPNDRRSRDVRLVLASDAWNNREVRIPLHRHNDNDTERSPSNSR